MLKGHPGLTLIPSQGTSRVGTGPWGAAAPWEGVVDASRLQVTVGKCPEVASSCHLFQRKQTFKFVKCQLFQTFIHGN